MAVKKEKTTSKVSYTTFQKKIKMKGSLEFTNPVKICGEFEGDIKGTGALYIETGAKIQAQIHVPQLIVYGHITGNITASEKVELHSGSHVIGNIRTPNLEIEDGVVFEGQCEMKQRAPEPVAVK
jgi:cytoskeletal protein CcmA (bactofilin family)